MMSRPSTIAWQGMAVIEKPDIAADLLFEGVRGGWGLAVTEIAFMPVGLDGTAWAYDVRTAGGHYFLKVRSGEYAAPAMILPSYLRDHGIQQVVAPIGGVRAVGDLRLALYPFVEGPDLWALGLTDAQWTAYGRFLGALHAVVLPAKVAASLPVEAYASTATQRIRALAGPAAADPMLGRLWHRHQATLSALANEVDRLKRDAAARRRPIVVCHADIHPGNLLANGDSDLRVVDWDGPIQAPRERDLMFVFGTDFGEHPINARREALFLAGYGPLEVDQALLRYYRDERRLDDIALFAATVLDKSATEATRAHELDLLTRILAGSD
jgi:spectinomycin phosphotransferase